MMQYNRLCNTIRAINSIFVKYARLFPVWIRIEIVFQRTASTTAGTHATAQRLHYIQTNDNWLFYTKKNLLTHIFYVTVKCDLLRCIYISAHIFINEGIYNMKECIYIFMNELYIYECVYNELYIYERVYMWMQLYIWLHVYVYSKILFVMWMLVIWTHVYIWMHACVNAGMGMQVYMNAAVYMNACIIWARVVY